MAMGWLHSSGTVLRLLPPLQLLLLEVCLLLLLPLQQQSML
jgi:hypothetical protein